MMADPNSVDGPIESLFGRLRRGEIDILQAETAAEQLGRSAALPMPFIGALSEAAFQAVHGGDWKLAVMLSRLLMAAVAAMPKTEAAMALDTLVSGDWVEIAHIVLCDRPNVGLYRNALQAGERAIDWARARGKVDTCGQLLFRLGTMHADPYTTGRTPSSIIYRQEHQAWLARESLNQGQPELRFPLPERGRASLARTRRGAMPEPGEALSIAEDCLRQALSIQSGEPKGYTIKALVQTLQFRDALGTPADRQEVATLCLEAARFLPPDDSEARNYLSGIHFWATRDG